MTLSDFTDATDGSDDATGLDKGKFGLFILCVMCILAGSCRWQIWCALFISRSATTQTRRISAAATRRLVPVHVLLQKFGL